MSRRVFICRGKWFFPTRENVGFRILFCVCVRDGCGIFKAFLKIHYCAHAFFAIIKTLRSSSFNYGMVMLNWRNGGSGAGAKVWDIGLPRCGTLVCQGVGHWFTNISKFFAVYLITLLKLGSISFWSPSNRWCIYLEHGHFLKKLGFMQLSWM